MRVLLSTIGSRGDVQPLVALALELQALGQKVRLCVPPDFRDWIEALSLPVMPIGPSCARPRRPLPPPRPSRTSFGVR
jgi:vancomycin aglycone glucosyltransferase